ncbi:MAG TPA: 2Fe-2S iron-sulfur cluster-binding protein [Thermoplasmata archaeon]|nr:2Fe-2S iron-sulfur cluster-binding protein [Thermoplasmata archaeon]
MSGADEGAIRYRGRRLRPRPGDTLSQAIARTGLAERDRSVRYHRPRAPFCGVGYCTNCLVRVNGRPNVRACRYVPAPGDSVEVENAWPSPGFDVLAVFDRLFPRGIDTLRGFRRPRWAVPAYQRVVRRLAGFGRLADPSASAPGRDGEDRETDLLIVGSGASGGTLSRSLAIGRRRTLLVDRGRLPTSLPGVEVLDRTMVVFLPPPDPSDPFGFHALAVRDGAQGIRIRAREVAVAVGGYDAGLLFAGNDRPGVVTADGAEALAPETDRPGFRRAVVFGAGARCAGLLERWGAFVEAVVAPGPVGPDVVRRASELDIPIYPRTMIVEAVGARAVRAVRLARRGGADVVRIPCDAVVLAHRRMPHPQLFFQAGAQMVWQSQAGGYFPRLTDRLETSVPGLYAVGEAAGFAGSEAADSGRRLGAILSGSDPAPSLAPGPPRPSGPHELEGYYRELLPHLPKRTKTIACACEDVLLGELSEASERGYRGIEVVKRYTGLGTGLCQGRYCLPDAILLLSIWEDRGPNEVGYITQRPPVVPTALSALAGLPDSPRAGRP